VTDEQNRDATQEEELPPAPEAEVKAESIDWQAQAETLQEQLAAAQDQALRTAADLQNLRRRAEQDVEKAHKFALERFAGDLLAVVDSLERGIELSDAGDAGNEAHKAMREGMELTLKLLLDTLKRHQIEPLDPHGAPFDPQQHQAMTTEENSEVEPNTVLRVFQKGYLLNGRLLRPAMVVVSKNASA